MKVLFIASDNNSSSGAFLSMTALNIYLNKEFGVETMIILPREGSGTILLEENNIPYQIIKSYDWIVSKDIKQNLIFKGKYFVKKKRNRSASKRIAKIAKEGQFDIIHINTIYSYVGALAAKQNNIPYVWHIREIIESGQNRKFISPTDSYALIGSASSIVTISESVYRHYFCNINCRNMKIIYNGIDERRFYKEGKQIFQSDKSIITFIGGFNVNKGAYAICDALSKVIARKKYDIEIWFIGEPTDKFRKHVTKRGLDEVAHFWGYQKNVEEFLEGSDITISGGKMEAFGRTTAEPMLCGNLVIATNSAGSKELIKDGETGLSYTFGQPRELVAKIEYALTHKEEMRKIAKKGQEFIRDNMTASINAKNVYYTYKRILFKLGK